MSEDASVPWVAVCFMLLLWLAVFGGGGWLHWHVVRQGADRPVSVRLFAAGHVAAAITSGMLFLIAAIQPAASGWALVVGVCVLIALVLAIAGGVARTVETEQTRRRQRALGQPVPPRMVPPWLLALAWFVVTVLALLLVLLGHYWWAWPQSAMQQPGVDSTATTLLVTTMAVCLACGAAHVFWQHHRRERARARAVTSD